MRRIELQELTLRNFRSFVQGTTIEFSAGAGLKLISGDNRVQPRLGANGAGKSTIWDGLAWCLTGASVKGLRASELTSWGEKQAYAKTILLIEGEEAHIERHGSPNKLLLNGEPVEQIAVDRLLGLSKMRLLQSVIFGQSVPLFIDLSIAERGALLDEVLDLGIWLKLSEEAGKKYADLSNELNSSTQRIAYLQGKLEGMPSGDDLTRQAAVWESEQEFRIEQGIQAVEESEAQLKACAVTVTTTKSAVDALSTPQSLRREISTLVSRKASYEAEYKNLFNSRLEGEKQLKFYEHTKTCPTCKQAIDRATAQATINSTKRAMANADKLIQENHGLTHVVTEELNALESEYDKLVRKRDFLIAQRATAESNLLNQQRIVDAAVHSVELIATAENPFQKQLEELLSAREQAERELRAAQGVKRRTQGAALRVEFWKNGFKRVRLFLVKRILSQLELETATAAIALGLAGWKISFSTELETKSGTLRPGIHVQVSSPSASATWEAWSGGEAQRIRLAVAIGLSSMIQRLAGISIGFEVWDEPSAWLSPEGIEDLLDCLKHRVETTGKSLWLCDHRALIYAGFDEIWTVTKTAEGSKVSLLSVAEGQ